MYKILASITGSFKLRCFGNAENIKMKMSIKYCSMGRLLKFYGGLTEHQNAVYFTEKNMKKIMAKFGKY